jgi:hypothetical protein
MKTADSAPVLWAVGPADAPGTATKDTCGATFVDSNAVSASSYSARRQTLAHGLLRGLSRVSETMPKRWMVLLAGVLGFLAAPVPLFAGTIDVAEVTLSLIGVDCSSDTPENCLADFTLEYLWVDGTDDTLPGPDPAPLEVTATIGVQMAGGPEEFDLFAMFLDPDNFGPQEAGVPLSATATVSFDFNGPISLAAKDFSPASLFDNDDDPLSETLLFQYEYDDTVTVPESATLPSALLGLLSLAVFALCTPRIARF